MSKRTSAEAGFSLYDDEDEIALKKMNSASDSGPAGELPSSASGSFTGSMDSNNNSVICGSGAFQGDRDEMQDRHVVKDDFRQEMIPVCNMYCARRSIPLFY